MDFTLSNLIYVEGNILLVVSNPRRMALGLNSTEYLLPIQLRVQVVPNPVSSQEPWTQEAGSSFQRRILAHCVGIANT